MQILLKFLEFDLFEKNELKLFERENMTIKFLELTQGGKVMEIFIEAIIASIYRNHRMQPRFGLQNSV